MHPNPFTLCKHQTKATIVRHILAHAMFENLLPQGLIITKTHPLTRIKAGWNSMSVSLPVDVLYNLKKCQCVADISVDEKIVRVKLSKQNTLMAHIVFPICIQHDIESLQLAEQ